MEVSSDKKKSINNKKIILLARVLLFLIGLFLTIYFGTKMYSNDFWGYWSFGLLLGIWLICNAILGLILTKSRSWKYFIYSTISGIMFYMAFPDLSITPLIFCAFIPLLAIVEKEYNSSSFGYTWRIFRYTFNSFFLWNILTTFWVSNTSFIPSFAAFGLNSLFMTIPFVGYSVLRKSIDQKWSVIIFTTFWLAFEYIHLRWEISWPWLTLGNAFASRTLWIQWYEYTGQLGGSLWTLLVNYYLFRFAWIVYKKESFGVSKLLIPVFAAIIPVIVSFFVYFSNQPIEEKINVAVIQPNFEPHFEKFTVSQNQQFERFYQLSQSVLHDSLDLLVFPETAFGCFNVEKLQKNPYIKGFQSMLDSFPRTQLVSGLCVYQLYDTLDNNLTGLREIKSKNKTQYIQYQNAAFSLTDSSFADSYHIKGKLVPGAEIFPYSKLLFFMKPIVRSIGGTLSGHAMGLPHVFRDGNTPVGVSICDESIYSYWMAKFVKQGAQLLCVITNDGWWDNTPGHRQHLAYACLRAIELRRSIVRSANTGISCFIDSRGTVLLPTLYDEQKAISTSLYSQSNLTFYARYGDYIGRIGILLSIVLCIFWVINKYQKRA